MAKKIRTRPLALICAVSLVCALFGVVYLVGSLQESARERIANDISIKSYSRVFECQVMLMDFINAKERFPRDLDELIEHSNLPSDRRVELLHFSSKKNVHYASSGRFVIHVNNWEEARSEDIKQRIPKGWAILRNDLRIVVLP